MFPNMNFGTLAQDDVIVNKDYSNNDEPQVFIPKRVWNTEYKEPITKNNLGVDCIDRQTAITLVCKNTKEILKDTVSLEVKLSDDYLYENIAKIMSNSKVLPSVTPQEPRKIKVLDRDEVTRKLGTVDIYKASAWITLLKDLDYLGMKICEVEE